jgi:hypothetical protein
MSTKSDRAFRVARHIQPVKLHVPQPDGSIDVQHVDADIREDKRRSKKRKEQRS